MAYSSTMLLADLTPAFFKKHYLVGLTLCGGDGQELDDDIYETHISTAIAKIEEITNVDILSHTTVGERHDYRVSDYVQYGFLQLFRLPTLSVQAVRAVYPTGQTIQTFPTEWIRLDASHSQIHLVPTSGSLAQVVMGQGGDFLPLIFSGLGYMPHLWEIDYTSGMDPVKLPRSVVDTILKYAAVELLQIMADTVTPVGLQSSSVSVDGLSQSRSYQMPAFNARITAYKADLGLPGTPDYNSGLISQIRASYYGVQLASL